jgi:hypothetical protein
MESKELHYLDMPDSDWKLFSAMTDGIKRKEPNVQLGATLGVQKLFNVEI